MGDASLLLEAFESVLSLLASLRDGAVDRPIGKQSPIPILAEILHEHCYQATDMSGLFPSWERIWIYQRERFPVVAHGVLVAAYSTSVVAYVSTALGLDAFPWLAAGVAFLLCFLSFLQLRIADEFKDYETDVRFRPERPVPRGLVSLRELRGVGIATGLMQLVACVSFDDRILVPLFIVWAYLCLMTAEFFIPTWLEAHPAPYLLSHLVILPLIAWLAGAGVWLTVGKPMPDVGLFLAFCYVSGAILELGRKIKSPEEERLGVAMYSSVWGVSRASLVWLLALGASLVLGTLAIHSTGMRLMTACLLGSLMLVAICVARVFASRPTRRGAKWIETFSAVWILVSHLVVGCIPFWLATPEV